VKGEKLHGTGTPEGSYLNNRDFSAEFTFTASRSSGPGGQHVNKVSTRIELRFDVGRSALLTDEEKEIIREKLAGKINNEGELIIVSQSKRSQLQNRERSVEKFYILLEKALKPKKKRKPTKPSRVSKEKRLEEKRIIAGKKSLRKKVD
jgi:ribosome-associated protein